MTNFSIFLFIFINVIVTYAKISDKRLCANSECSEPVSLARTLLRYNSDDIRILSFQPNVEVKIFSKSAGCRSDLWGAEINGKRGYIPKSHVRETKILYKGPLEHLVSTEEPVNPPTTTSDTVHEHISPDSVPQPYEVIDGTTLYLNPSQHNESYPSTTEPPSSSSAAASTTDSLKLAERQSPQEQPDTDYTGSTEDKPKDAVGNDHGDDDNDVDEEDMHIIDQRKQQAAEESDSVPTTETQVPTTESLYNPEIVQSAMFSVSTERSVVVNGQETMESTQSSVDNDQPKVDSGVTESGVVNEQEKTNVVSLLSSSNVISTADIVHDSINTEAEASNESESESTVVSDSQEVPSGLLTEPNSNTDEPSTSTVSLPSQVPSDPFVFVPSTVTPAHDIPAPIETSVNSVTDNSNETVAQLTTNNTHQNSQTQDTVQLNISSELVENHTENLIPQTGNKQVSTNSNDNEVTQDGAPDVVYLTTQLTVNTQEPADILTETPFMEKKLETDSAEPVTEAFIATEGTTDEQPGFFSKMFGMFGLAEENPQDAVVEEVTMSQSYEQDERDNVVSDVTETSAHVHLRPADTYLTSAHAQPPSPSDTQTCYSNANPSDCIIMKAELLGPNVESTFNLILCLTLTAITVLLFSLGYYFIEKKRQDGLLILNINNLEKKLLVSTKECALLQDELKTTKERLSSIEDSSFGSNEMVSSLKVELEEAGKIRSELEEQIGNLEKELENATEAGMELNRMLREILSSQTGNEHLVQNIEQLQKQLNEQQVSMNVQRSTLDAISTENEMLQAELTLANQKLSQLQSELDNALTTRAERDQRHEHTLKQIHHQLKVLQEDNAMLQSSIQETQRSLEVKNKEYVLLSDRLREVGDKELVGDLLDVTSARALAQQAQVEAKQAQTLVQEETSARQHAEQQLATAHQQVDEMRQRCEQAERSRVEAHTRLDVLSTYFSEREAQLQRELSEREALWVQKQGEATTTVERIRWIQDELQNYKVQNELLKKEILDQEVSLKSQISLLEQKVHDQWLASRQAERRLEEARQEAKQLRHRLTQTHGLDDTVQLQMRIRSPLEVNGEVHMEGAGSPLLYGAPPPPPPPPPHPFMPPPPHPFMPPPPSFMPPPPPPPALFDHRPPPLGRMSSPYQPPSPSPPPPLSPAYNDNDLPTYRERPRYKPRNHKRAGLSSGSNESLPRV